MIPDQIIQSVESSRRTLIVLSKAYVDSMWTKLEFRAAHTQVNLLVFVNSSNCISCRQAWIGQFCKLYFLLTSLYLSILQTAFLDRPCKTRRRGWSWWCVTRTWSRTRRAWRKTSRDTSPSTHISIVRIHGSGRGSGVLNVVFVSYMFLLKVALIWCWKEAAQFCQIYTLTARCLGKEISKYL